MNVKDLNAEITKLITAAGSCSDITSSERAELTKRLREARQFGYTAEQNAARRTTPVYDRDTRHAAA